MKYPMDESAKKKFENFIQYAEGHDENSLTHAIRSFIVDGEMDLDKRRKRTLYVAALVSNMAVHAFNALEETSRTYENGQTDQIFELRRMKPLNKELNELTSAANYESMTNQSAMRKLYSALTDLTWNTMWDIDTRGKTRDEYRNEIRVVQAEFNELMVGLQAGDGDPEEVNARLIELDDQLDDMEHAWRRMKRK